MNKVLSILIAVLVLSSCTKKFSDLNKDPKNPTEVPSETLFTNALKNAGDQIASTNVNQNNFKLWSQYWTETTYTDESNYDVKTRGVPDEAFEVWYRDVISDLAQSRIVLDQEGAIPGEEAVLNNKRACIEIMTIYSYQRLVDMFGDVPYTESLNVVSNLNPKYDDSWTIYQDLQSRLANAIGLIDAAQGGFGAADLIYGGDMNGWLAFAHGLHVKMGITIADAHPTEAQAWIEFSAAAAIPDAMLNAEMDYLGSTPNTNPLHVDLVLSGRQDFVAGQTIIDTMLHYNDNRIDEYFNVSVNTGVHSGGGIGESNTWGDHSTPGDKLLDPTFPVLFCSYLAAYQAIPEKYPCQFFDFVGFDPKGLQRLSRCFVWQNE